MSEYYKISFYKKLLNRGHQRTVRAKKNIIVSFISKGLIILINFIIVPLTLNYVGKVEYGIWMTLSSIIHWFTFFDIGLGNGLRNKLAEVLAKRDYIKAKVYISSSFVLIALIAFIMFICFFIFARFISWNNVLNTDAIPNSELSRIVIFVFFLFCIGFVLNMLSPILQAMQKYWLRDVLSVITQLIGLLGIFILVKTTEGSLFNLCVVYAGKTPIVMGLATLIFFIGSLKYLRPQFRYIKIKLALPLINLGIKFFLSQIFYLIVTQSSLFIVAQFFGPTEVTVYNLAVKYMTIGTMGYMMVLTPFLSAFTEAYTKDEYSWIKATMKRINFIWILTSVLTIILALIYRMFFKFWVGNAIQIPLSLIISLAISGIIQTYYNKFSLFFNGIGKIQLQLYLVGIQALLFVPLSFLFFKLKLGLVSIVASQIILYFLMAYFLFIQYKKIISKTAQGIWDK